MRRLRMHELWTLAQTAAGSIRFRLHYRLLLLNKNRSWV